VLAGGIEAVHEPSPPFTGGVPALQGEAEAVQEEAPADEVKPRGHVEQKEEPAKLE